jgi:hypothetical protein
MDASHRFHRFVDPDRRVIVFRPIGDVSADAFVEGVFAALEDIPEPWTYNRLFDLRRWDERLRPETVHAMAGRWAALTEGQIFHARIAVVSFDPAVTIRTPAATGQFPDEIVCHFTDYHEAMEWMTAIDPAAYLAEARQHAPNRAIDGRIVIE